jgi:WD40 repeat protein
VSGSQDDTVRVWDAETGAELACLRGHYHWVSSVAYSPDCLRIASGSWDHTARVWGAASGAEDARLREHKGLVSSAPIYPYGLCITNGSTDDTVRVWSTLAKDYVEASKGDRRPPDVAVIADGEKAVPYWAISCRDGMMSLRDETAIVPAARGEPVAWFPIALYYITTHPSGRIWAGSVGNYIYIIQLEGNPEPAHSIKSI